MDPRTQQLLEDLGFASVSEEQKQEVLAKLQEMVDTEILYAVTSRLKDDQIDELEAVTSHHYSSDDEKGQAIVSKMKALLPDYEDVVGRALDDLYTQVKADAAAASAFLATHPPKDDHSHQTHHQPTHI